MERKEHKVAEPQNYDMNASHPLRLVLYFVELLLVSLSLPTPHSTMQRDIVRHE